MMKNFLELIFLRDTKASFISEFQQSRPLTVTPSELNIELVSYSSHFPALQY